MGWACLTMMKPPRSLPQKLHLLPHYGVRIDLVSAVKAVDVISAAGSLTCTGPQA